MHWIASHFDGFTNQLFGYELHVTNGHAELKADWFRPEPSTKGFRAQFAIDEDPVVRAIPALRDMDEQYESHWEDLDHKRLIVQVGAERISRQVYGGRELLSREPILKSFLELFDWIEDQIVPHLPWGLKENTGARKS